MIFLFYPFYIIPLATIKKPIVRPVFNYSYDRLCRDLYALKKRYPLKIRVGEIGKSQQKRNIYSAVIGAPGAPCHILIQAAIHAREYMTSLLAMMQLEELLIKGVPKGFNFHFIPMVNPDGVTISQGLADCYPPEEIYKRDLHKGYTSLNQKDYYRQYKANASGVDLNRNFDAGWDKIDTTPFPSYANYKGSHPFSEEESKALAAYTQRFPFGATLSYHASGGEIYYEFGNNISTNEKSLSLARCINKCARYALVPDGGTSFGGYKDWAIEKLSIPSLTIEIGRNETPLKLHEYPDIWKRNCRVPFLAAEWLRQQAKGI